MSNTEHRYVVDSHNDRATVFVCPEDGCGRRVVLERGASRYIVIDRGDFFATHSGAVGPISFSITT